MNESKEAMPPLNRVMRVIEVVMPALAVVLPLIAYRYFHLEGLTHNGAFVLAIFFCAVAFWILDTFPDYITAMMLMAALVFCNSTSFNNAFSAFSAPTVWLVLGAFTLSAAIESSGLLKRFSLNILSKFPLTFFAQTCGILLSSLIISPLIPSAAGKSAVLAPLTKEVCKNMGYAPQSKGAIGIFSAMYLPNGMLYAVFLSASFMNYMLLGMMPESVQKQITWFHWFFYASVWFMVVLLGVLAFILIKYTPKKQVIISQNNIKTLKGELGKFSRKEKIVLAVLMSCLLLWSTETLHGINSTMVILMAMCTLVIAQVINRDTFRHKIPWDLIVFIGAVNSCGSVFKSVGLDEFFSESLAPYIIPLLEQHLAWFIVVMTWLIYAIRVIISSQTAAITIFVLLLTPVAYKAGINPWVLAFIVYTSGLVFIVKYQNITYLTTLAMVAGDEKEKALVEHRQMVPLAICFMIMSTLGLVCSIPLWRALGLI